MLPIAPTLTPPATAVLVGIESRREKWAQAGQPEEWEIRGQCCIRDTPVGLPSEIATVLVRG